MVKHGEEGGDKDDGGQNLEGEDGALIGGLRGQQIAEGSGVGKAELAKQNPGSSEGRREHGSDYAASPSHELLSVVEAQHEEGEGKLQAKAPGDGAPADTFAVG